MLNENEMEIKTADINAFDDMEDIFTDSAGDSADEVTEIAEYSGMQLPDNLQDLALAVKCMGKRRQSLTAEIELKKALAATAEEIKGLDEILFSVAEQELDAESYLGAMLSRLPTARGKRTDISTSSSQDDKVCKSEVLNELGINKNLASEYERIAANPDILDSVKNEMREKGKQITHKAVISAIKKLSSVIPANTNNGGKDTAKDDVTDAECLDTYQRIISEKIAEIERLKALIIEKDNEIEALKSKIAQKDKRIIV